MGNITYKAIASNLRKKDYSFLTDIDEYQFCLSIINYEKRDVIKNQKYEEAGKVRKVELKLNSIAKSRGLI